MTRLLAGCVFLLLYNSAVAEDQHTQSLTWPTDASNLMTSSFAEYREHHFHSGIDIKTWGQTGYKVFAVADGWVSRIKVSPLGYGRALYITLHDGRTIVYGHLEEFANPVSDYVWNAQKNRGQYSVELFPAKNQFPVKSGQVVAYTGESGAGPPHLHYEIRLPGQQPVNPLSQGVEIEDTIRPTIRYISLTPMNAYSAVDGIPMPRLIRMSAHSGLAVLEEPVMIQGQIGFALRAFDKANGAANRFNVYRAVLEIGDSIWFETTYDQFGYHQTNQILLERDWRLNVQGKGSFIRLYRHPKNTLGFYPPEMNGVVDCRQFTSSPVPFRIAVEDYNGNLAQVRGELVPSSLRELPQVDDFDQPCSAQYLASGIEIAPTFFDNYLAVTLQSAAPLHDPPRAWMCTNTWKPLTVVLYGVNKWIGTAPLDFYHTGLVEIHSWGTTASGDTIAGHKEWQQYPVHPYEPATVSFPNAGFHVAFSTNSLWQPICLRIEPTEAPVEDIPYLSTTWQVDPEDIPLSGDVQVEWEIPLGQEPVKQIGIYRWTRKDYWKILTPFEYSSDGCINAPTDELGKFVLIRDDVSPVVVAMFPADQAWIKNATPKIEVRVSDMLSGIEDTNIKMFLDGNLLISEYDPDAQKVKYRVRQPLSRGEHHLTTEVRDRAGNLTIKRTTFHVTGGSR
jgi:hypothetical protein